MHRTHKTWQQPPPLAPSLLTVSEAILVTFCLASNSALVGANKSQKSRSSLCRRRRGGRERGLVLMVVLVGFWMGREGERNEDSAHQLISN